MILSYSLSSHEEGDTVTVKNMRAGAFIALVVLAGIAATIRAQDQSKKPAAPDVKTEQAAKTKSKTTGKMKCCMMDSTSCSKDGKSCCDKTEKR